MKTPAANLRPSPASADSATTPVQKGKGQRDSALWKEQVREACLRRALQSRERRKRPLESHLPSSFDPQQQQLQESHDEQAIYEPSPKRPFGSPRMFLEQELRQRGVYLESPLHAIREITSENALHKPMAISENDPENYDNDVEEPYTMTEDEFIDLLEEIEADFEMNKIEEELAIEEEMLQDQIDSFQSQMEENTGLSSISCPLCKSGYLGCSPCAEGTLESVHCSQCPFSLAGVTTLANLQQRIDTAQGAHADFCSEGYLEFCNPDQVTLTASCQFCGTHMVLYGT